MTAHERAAEVDTRLAALWGERQGAFSTIASTIDSLHRVDGQQPDRWSGSRRPTWSVSAAATEESVRAKLATPDTSGNLWFSHPSVRDGEPYLTHHGTYALGLIDRLDAARLAVVRIDHDAAPLEAEYRADPWPRFFLVMNTGGHIHSSMDCATTFPTTQWAWLPDLSGLTEDAAVASQGPRLCSVCYPSAPVEWTVGLPKAPRCPGSGERPAPGYERYASRPCAVCGRSYPVSRTTGLVRAHKPQEA